MAKQVIEPEIISQGQVSPRQESEQKTQTNFRFYHTKNTGCLGLIIFAFITFFIVLPSVIFNFFKKK